MSTRSSPVKLAVFDCDGTLIDGQASICAAMEAAFAEFGLPLPPRNLIRRAVGLSLPQAVRRLLGEDDETLHRDLAEAYKRHFREARASGALEQRLIDGVAPLLDMLRDAGWLLGVATGMSDRGLAHCLAANGIAGHFVTLQTADRHPSKPHPAMLEAALFEAAALPGQAVMIGDTVYDIDMAASAGVRGIGVDWGYHESAELTAAGARFVAATPAELGEYLSR
ncbi:MAG: HAD-IA family hydrolase [Novosphingobium sp.]